MIPSVKEEVDPLSEAKSQVWFIETFAKPLFDLTATGIPGPLLICFHTTLYPSDLVFMQKPRHTRITAPRTLRPGKKGLYRFPPPMKAQAQVQSRIPTVT
jgi:hypothetical protein